MDKKIKKVLKLITVITAGMYAYNKFIEYTSQSRHLTLSYDENYYAWRNGRIFYQKKGTGKPVLFIHDLHPISSSYEWSHIIDKMSRTHTVYTIDLIGCGKSEKPEQTYINYLYVELIHDFIQDVIGEKTDIVTSGASFTFTVMSAKMNADQIDHIIAINPTSISYNQEIPDKITKCKKTIFEFPIIGTFLYNVITSNHMIYCLFSNKYYKDFARIPSKLPDIYYESSHSDGSNGRYLYGSIISNYTNVNICDAIAALNQQIAIIYSEDYSYVKEYKKYKSDIHFYQINQSGYLPQLECPTKVIQAIKNELL